MPEYPWLKQYPPAVPAHIDYPRSSVPDLLAEAARKYPERTALWLDGPRMTFAGLEREVRRAAGNLVRLGMRKGERVGLFLPNTPEFVVGFLAILKAGAVAAAFNPLYKPGEFAAQARDAGVGLVLTDPAGYEVLKAARVDAGLKQILVTGGGGNLDESDLPYEELRIDNGTELPVLSPDDPVIYQYSGGTTGTPKGAIALHRNLVANALQFRAWLWNCRDGEETILAAIPLYHVYGMVLAMCLGLSFAATLALVPNPRDLGAFQAAIERAKPTVFPAVPGLLGLLGSLPADAPGVAELKRLKAVISGAAPLPAGVRARFEALSGVIISEGFGLSEAPTATHCNPVGERGKPGSVGLPLPGVEARIVSLEDETSDLPPGQPGELVLRGPQVMQGYLNLPEETRLALRDGWLYTGDIAVMDEDGYFTLVDRKKDLIKSGGLQVWPREVEDVLLQHPAVADAGAAGIPDELRGEAVGAWVVVRPGMNLTVGEVRAWCREHLAPFKVPRVVTFVEKLPRSGVGKLLRRELRGLVPK